MAKESVGGIWIKEITVKGEKVNVMTFQVDGKKYVAWPNKSDNPKAPKYRIFVDDFVPKSGNTEKAQTGHVPEKANDLPF